MEKLRGMVNDYLTRMDIEPTDCRNESYPDCWFVRKGSATAVIIANETENRAATLGFVAPVIPLPKTDNLEGLFRKLLSLNYAMLHGAFSLDRDEESIVIIDNLQAENLDFDEFSASLMCVLEAADKYDDKLRSEYGQV